MFRSRRVIGRFVVAALLFAQFAIAAHACPVALPTLGTAGSATSEPMMPAMLPDAAGAPCSHAAQPGAEPKAEAMPTLCVEHCRFGQQSDQTQSLTVPALASISLYGVRPAAEPSWPAHLRSTPEVASVAASPPHSILHCSLLI